MVYPFTGLEPIPYPRGPLPQELTHYTTQLGVTGIIGSGELWATDIRFLNDSAEFNYALGLAMEVVAHRSDSEQSKDRARVLRDVKIFLNSFEPVPRSHVFSFSAVVDDLSQWRAYTANGRGYGLVFDAKTLAKLAAKLGIRVVRCEYRAAEQRRLIEKALDWVLHNAAQLETGDTPNVPLATGYVFSSMISLMAPALKHRAFSAEKEWRMVALSGVDQPHISGVREGRLGLLPYLRVVIPSLLESSLRRIMLGPMPDQGRENIAVKALLTSRGLRKVTTGYSQVPYRSW